MTVDTQKRVVATLTQQVEAALTDEVMATAWERLHPEAMRELVLSALAPVLAQQEATVTTLTAERDRAREMVTLHHVECHDPDCVKEIATWPTK